jgi:hypothetical protein
MIPALFFCHRIAPHSDYPNVVCTFEHARQHPNYAKVMAEFVPIWQNMQNQSAKT